jgi:hypothetical protein
VSGLQQVHVRVIDADTGKPTPCRVRFTDAEGKYYAPYGRLTAPAGIDVAGGNLTWPILGAGGPLKVAQFAYIDGGCEIALPPGPVAVTICKGPEYLPVEQEIQLTAGKLAMRFLLHRWSNLRQSNWYSGDARAHFLSPPAALLEGAAEDLAVINVLARVTQVEEHHTIDGSVTLRPSYANLLDFSGQRPALERDGHMVVVNALNSHDHLGSLGLLNCHRVVYPLRFGVDPDEYDDWTLADWCDQCHRKHGLVVCVKGGFEALADLILGKVDAIEIIGFDWTHPPHTWLSTWYDLLNCGFRVPSVGSSGKDSSQLPLGSTRSYARLQPDRPFNYANWIEAVRAGRTFVTNGPLLQLKVNGQDPGATLDLADQEAVQIQVEARSLVPFEHLEIIVNGGLAAETSAGGNPCEARIDSAVQIPPGGWIAARCWGKTWVPGSYAGQYACAHTSAIYVRKSGRPAPANAEALQRLLGNLMEGLSWVDRVGRYENDAQRLRLRKVFEDAIQVLQKRGRG